MEIGPWGRPGRWPLGQALQQLSQPPLSPNRGGYTLTMRECEGVETVLDRLAGEAVDPGPARRLHVGWGSFRNLDIAAARRSAAIVLLDVNRHQFDVWSAVAAALADTGDAESFIDALLPRLPLEPRLRQFASSTRTWLRGDLERPGSWLEAAAPARFDHVRQCFADGSVMAACVDLRSTAACRALDRALQDSAGNDALQLDTLYPSNIPWMLAQPLGFFGEAHDACGDGVAAGAVLDRVQHNLGRLAASFRWVVSAMRLRDDASADNLQWRTELCPGAVFAHDPAWRRLGPVAPA